MELSAIDTPRFGERAINLTGRGTRQVSCPVLGSTLDPIRRAANCGGRARKPHGLGRSPWHYGRMVKTGCPETGRGLPSPMWARGTLWFAGPTRRCRIARPREYVGRRSITSRISCASAPCPPASTGGVSPTWAVSSGGARPAAGLRALAGVGSGRAGSGAARRLPTATGRRSSPSAMR